MQRVARGPGTAAHEAAAAVYQACRLIREGEVIVSEPGPTPRGRQATGGPRERPVSPSDGGPAARGPVPWFGRQGALAAGAAEPAQGRSAGGQGREGDSAGAAAAVRARPRRPGQRRGPGGRPLSLKPVRAARMTTLTPTLRSLPRRLLAVTPQGQILCYEGGVAAALRASDGAVFWTFTEQSPGPDLGVAAVDESGQRLAYTSAEGLSVRDTVTGGLVARWPWRANSLKFIDPDLLLVASEPRLWEQQKARISLVEVGKDEPSRIFSIEEEFECHDLRRFPQHEVLVARGHTYDCWARLFIWDTRTGELLETFCKELYGGLLLSPGGRFLVVYGDEGGALYGWSLRGVNLRAPAASWPRLSTWQGPHPCRSHTLFSPDDALLIVAGLIAEPDKEPRPVRTRLRVMATATLGDVLVYERPGVCYAIAVSPDGCWLAAIFGVPVGWHDPVTSYELHLWGLPGCTSHNHTTFSSSACVARWEISASFSPDSRHLVVECGGWVALLDVEALAP